MQRKTRPLATDDHQTLLARLQALEMLLHQGGLVSPPQRIEALLHPEFHEVGRSGRRYDRATVVRHLTWQHPTPSIVAWEFSLSSLGEHVALLHYRSAQQRPDGSRGVPCHRLSVWERGAESWQLRFHQGTPLVEAEEAFEQTGMMPAHGARASFGDRTPA